MDLSKLQRCQSTQDLRSHLVAADDEAEREAPDARRLVLRAGHGEQAVWCEGHARDRRGVTFERALQVV